MAPSKKPAPAAAAPAEPMYPQIEALIEKATPADVEALFAPLKESLAGLKGPRAEQVKKVNKAIDKTEALLSHLIQVREKLETDRKGQGGARR